MGSTTTADRSCYDEVANIIVTCYEDVTRKLMTSYELATRKLRGKWNATCTDHLRLAVWRSVNVTSLVASKKLGHILEPG